MLAASVLTAMSAWAFGGGHGTALDPYLITSSNDWNELADGVNEFHHSYSGVYFRQTADINVSETNAIGTITNYPFSGNYDGDGKTLVINFNIRYQSEQAPFRYVNGATLSNIVVSGNNTTEKKHSSCLIGQVGGTGTTTVTNCRVSAGLTWQNDPSKGSGSLVGDVLSGATLVMEGCLFDGAVHSPTGGNHFGGLVYASTGANVTLTNCFFKPSAITGFSGNNLSPLVEGITVFTATNCYYTPAFGTAQDHQGYTFSGENGAEVVRTDAPVATYSVSGIAVYAVGLGLNGTSYVGEGESIPVTLLGSTEYSASPGTLSGTGDQRTLTFSGADAVIHGAAYATVAPQPAGCHYTGSPLTLVTPGQVSGGEMWYKLDDGAYSTALPQATEVGDYTVYCQPRGDSIHPDGVEFTLACSVGKGYPVITERPMPTLWINQHPGESRLIQPGTVTHGTFWYSKDKVNWSTEIPTSSVYDDHYVYYKVVAENENYNDLPMDFVVSSIRLGPMVQPWGFTDYTDVTLLAAQQTNSPAGHGAEKLLDGDITTQWESGEETGDNYSLRNKDVVVWKTAQPINVIAYTLVTSNMPYYNWSYWTLFGGAFQSDEEAMAAMYSDEWYILRNNPMDMTIREVSRQPFSYGVTALQQPLKYYRLIVYGLPESSRQAMSELILATDGNEDLTILDDANNNDVLHWAYHQFQQFDVLLAGRTLYRDGNWNTLCLPFTINDFAGTPFEGATVKTLESSSFDTVSGTLTLNFSGDRNSIVAGHPYIVKWDSGDNLQDPWFTDKLLFDSTALRTVETDYVTFAGSFNSYDYYTPDSTTLLLGANNQLFYPQPVLMDPGRPYEAGSNEYLPVRVGACRATFRLKNGLKAGNPSNPNTAPLHIELNFDGNNTTRLGSETGGIAERAVKFLRNNTLYIRRNGVIYDVTGCRAGRISDRHGE